MAVNIIDIENSSNIGIFFKSNDKYILIPNELPDDKSRNLKNYLNVKPIISTISGTRLNGALTIMNNSGILVSKIITERELRLLREQVDLPVEILPTKYTCIGNIITVNEPKTDIRDNYLKRIFQRLFQKKILILLRIH